MSMVRNIQNETSGDAYQLCLNGDFDNASN